MILGADFGSLEALVERLLARVRELESTVVQRKRVIAEQADRIVELDVEAPPPPKVTEYQLVSLRWGGCGHVSDSAVTDVPRRVGPRSDQARPAADAPDEASARDQARAPGLPPNEPAPPSYRPGRHSGGADGVK